MWRADGGYHLYGNIGPGAAQRIEEIVGAGLPACHPGSLPVKSQVLSAETRLEVTPPGRLTMRRLDHALGIAFGLLRNRSEHKATAEAEPEAEAEAVALAETGRQIAALCGRRRTLG